MQGSTVSNLKFQTPAELGKILQVDESTVSKRLKVFKIIQKQGHWMPFELKLREVRSFFSVYGGISRE